MKPEDPKLNCGTWNVLVVDGLASDLAPNAKVPATALLVSALGAAGAPNAKALEESPSVLVVGAPNAKALVLVSVLVVTPVTGPPKANVVELVDDIAGFVVTAGKLTALFEVGAPNEKTGFVLP